MVCQENRTPGSGAARVNAPVRTLYTGAKIPHIGLGTFGSDHVPGEEIAAAVKDAVSLGYRLIDCASVYGNEAVVGSALREAMAGGVAREELFITSKLWNDMHGEGDVLLSCARTLKDIKLEYIDLYLILALSELPRAGVGVDSRMCTRCRTYTRIYEDLAADGAAC